MKNIKLVKAKEGKGWFLDVEDVFEAPLTALELLTIRKLIQENWDELVEEAKV